ncbi:MAG: TRAP transporter permease [Rhodospirillales bacterium]|nr:TRAP transporter permease [Rhodospirillales bacterium]
MPEAKTDLAKNTGESVEKLSESIDMGGRHPAGLEAKFLFLAAFSWSLYQIYIASPLPYVTGILMIDDTQDRAIHVAFCLFLGFCAYPMFNKSSPRGYVPWYDWAFAIVSSLCCFYIIIFYEEISDGAGGIRTMTEVAVSVIGVLCVMEITRRALGVPLTIVSSVFLAYMFLGPYMPEIISHRGASLNRAVDHMWLTTEGVFGIAAGVSTKVIFLFVLFGALLQRAGSGNYLIQLSFALLGHLRGGPAKASVVSSGLTGVVSGSTIANIVTTGTFTIPLMKRIGFPAHKAGAIETSSSLNGQVMPPVMGAAAFIMTEFIGITYFDVIKHAFLPAVISYIGLYFIVHAEAEKAKMMVIERAIRSHWARRLFVFVSCVLTAIILSGLLYFASEILKATVGDATLYVAGIFFIAVFVGSIWISTRYPALHMDDPNSKEIHLPDTWPTFMAGLHFILPIIVLIWCLIAERFSAGLAVSWAITAQVFVLVAQHPLKILLTGRNAEMPNAIRAGLDDLIQGMASGARNMVGVAIAMASAGIIVGVVSLTGLGISMTAIIEALSGGSFIIALLLTAVICVILGMGLPTTANYIVVIAVMGPVVVELAAQNGLVVPLVAVHLFVFYFGLLSGTTPPVAIDAFVGAGVARADPLKTSLQSFYYSMRTAILPFIFIFNSELLLIGIDSIWHFLLTVTVSVTAIVVFSASLQGWLFCRSRIWESALLLVISLTLLRPAFWLDLVQPPFDAVPPSTLMDIVETQPDDGSVRVRVRGEKFGGSIGERVAVFYLGKKGEMGPERFEKASGITVAFDGGKAIIDNVNFGSEAEKQGITFDWEILEVQVRTERMAKEWFLLPAVLVLALLSVLQIVRKRKEDEAEAETTVLAVE